MRTIGEADSVCANFCVRIALDWGSDWVMLYSSVKSKPSVFLSRSSERPLLWSSGRSWVTPVIGMLEQVRSKCACRNVAAFATLAREAFPVLALPPAELRGSAFGPRQSVEACVALGQRQRRDDDNDDVHRRTTSRWRRVIANVWCCEGAQRALMCGVGNRCAHVGQ